MGENAEIIPKSENTETPLKKKKRLWEKFKYHIDSKLVASLIITVIATILGGVAVKWIIDEVAYYRLYSRPYITFESNNMQVFHLSNKVPTLEYSVGEKRWTELGTQYIVFGGSHGKLLLRGQSKKGTAGATISFATNTEVICTGDICTLIDYKHYDEADTKEACFIELFKNCTQLVIAPELTPMTLSAQCYQRMFYNCTSLKTAPKLPATKLANWCYYEMFQGCTSLITAPELPADSLADMCYFYMFSGCTSLERAPELPASILVKECYSGMFYHCTSLNQGPLLHAKELAEKCYSSMFRDCISLSEIAMLAEKIWDPNCLSGWLENVSQDGTFYKKWNAQWKDYYIVPRNWKIELVNSYEIKDGYITISKF